MRTPARFRYTPPAVVAFLALVLASCGGDTTSPTSATTPPSLAAPTDGLVSPAAENIGGKYEVDGRELAISCEGSGSPTFVIEGGEGMSMSDFSGLRAELATRGTACTYSRAAVSGGTVDGEQVVADLNALLGMAEVPRPLVLVGHSAGGMFVQLHARLHPADVLGVLSMNPVPPWEQWQTEAFPAMNEEERAAETAYFSGDNGESLDYATTSEQIDSAPAPSEMPFHLVVSDETQCHGDSLCERVAPAYESIMRDVTEAWPRGQLAVVPASHEIFRDDVQAILDAVDHILADVAGVP
jgi:pimeloyl-ACP methyl ester carboxylesterase